MFGLMRKFLRLKRIVVATIIGVVAFAGNASATVLTATEFSTADALANVAFVGIAILGVRLAWYGIQVAKRMIG